MLICKGWLRCASKSIPTRRMRRIFRNVRNFTNITVPEYATTTDDGFDLDNVITLANNYTKKEDPSLNLQDDWIDRNPYFDTNAIAHHDSYIEIKTEFTETLDIPSPVSNQKSKDYVTVMCISDTHNLHKRIDTSKWKDLDIDILLHSGDMTFGGLSHEFTKYDKWIKQLKDDKIIKESVVIAGNHDMTLDKQFYVHGTDYYENTSINSDEYADQIGLLRHKDMNSVVDVNDNNKMDFEQMMIMMVPASNPSDAKWKLRGYDLYHSSTYAMRYQICRQVGANISDSALRTQRHLEDNILEDYCDLCLETVKTNSHYLQDSAVGLMGLKIYGSPYQPYFCHWAFNQLRGEVSKAKWKQIANDADIVMTHGPPFLHGDRTFNVRGIKNVDSTLEDQYSGCKELILRLNEIKPKYHISGHLHEGYGVTRNKLNDVTTFINPSTPGDEYKVKTFGKMLCPPVMFKIAKKRH